MRFLYAILFFLVVFNFSGIPDVLTTVLNDAKTYCAFADDSDEEERSEKNKEDSKEKEEKEKEKEDSKESLLCEDQLLCAMGLGHDLSMRNRLLLEEGFIPEDHCPPPEFI